MKKLLVFGVIVLFLSVSVIPSIGTTDVKQITTPATSGNTLYVGGSGEGNYTKIQDALDNASNGDTVFVYDNSSPYYEHVRVKKSINLIGENRNTTVVDGTGCGIVVVLYADWVNISGFTIRNGEEMGICISSNYNTISGNDIHLCNNWGINLYRSSNNVISGNDIHLCNDCGITIGDSNNNTITGNNISNNLFSIILEGSNNNIIKGNILTSNNYAGIDLGGSHNNTISGNIIINNYFGIDLHSYSNYNNITNNNIQNNEIFGLFLSYANYNVIESNNFIGNKIQASFIFSKKNNWDENYWDNWIGFKIKLPIFPKVIIGFIGINFDWHPAQELYDIPSA